MDARTMVTWFHLFLLELPHQSTADIEKRDFLCKRIGYIE